MSERAAIDHVLADFRRELHTCFPAQVLAYNVTAQTVDVRPGVQRELPSDQADAPFQTESLPILYSVPVQWPRAGGGALTFPILVGDWVAVHCAEQSLLVWRQTGDVDASPGMSDPHGLNGAYACPGWYPDTEALSSVSSTDAELRAPTGGVVVLGGQASAQFVALSNLVNTQLTALKSAISGAAVVANDGGAAFKSNIMTALSAWPGSVAATKVKAL